jgi:twitching motility protein PilT
MAFCAEIQCLAIIGAERGLFTLSQARQIAAGLNENAEVVDFAQQLIDRDIVEDVAALEAALDEAMKRAASGVAVRDPFSTAPAALKLASSRSVDAPAPAAAPVPVAPARVAVPAAAAAVQKSAKGNMAFPFQRIASLDEEELSVSLRALLVGCARDGASDLHLSTGARPFIRKNRRFEFLTDYVLTAKDSLRLNTALLSEGQKKTFLDRKDYDYALAFSNTDRYRVNLMVHKNGAAGAYRMVPDKVRSLDELGFTAHIDTIKKMLSYHNGLILITGPVGSGKTTTLASMVDYLNTTRTDHIITVEDPIEVVQPAKGCNVSQREVGPHTKSFFTALKGALREDPDVIIIGELRDLETIEMAISASETGHLVIGTMHTSDAATTLNRLLDVFPPAQQSQIRASVSESLRGIVCQRLLPSAAEGLTLACEILVSNTAIQNLIREGKTTGLRNTMETGLKDGMCLMDNVVFALHQERKISAETALANINSRILRSKIS